VPGEWLEKARELAALEDPGRRWSLQALATELGVHVRTLRDAARNGRLAVTYDNRVVFGHPVPKATMAAGRGFVAEYYRRSYSRMAPKPKAPEKTRVPPDYAPKLLRLRRGLRLTQGQLATKNRGGWQGGGLSVGIWQAAAIACVLAQGRAIEGEWQPSTTRALVRALQPAIGYLHRVRKSLGVELATLGLIATNSGKARGEGHRVSHLTGARTSCVAGETS
jgi:hypothetical protein